VRANVTIDWTVRENVRAQLRVLVMRILSKRGYPPDKQEKATQTVLEQAAVCRRNGQQREEVPTARAADASPSHSITRLAAERPTVRWHSQRGKMAETVELTGHDQGSRESFR
jgi:type I restriction enzyme R subunit